MRYSVSIPHSPSASPIPHSPFPTPNRCHIPSPKASEFLRCPTRPDERASDGRHTPREASRVTISVLPDLSYLYNPCRSSFHHFRFNLVVDMCCSSGRMMNSLVLFSYKLVNILPVGIQPRLCLHYQLIPRLLSIASSSKTAC